MFTYPRNSYSNDKVTSVITREQAEAAAILFEAADLSPYSTDWDKENNKTGPASYLRVPALAEAVANFPQWWTLDVSHVLDERRAAKRIANIRASYEAVEHAAIREYLLNRIDSTDARYLRAAEVRDESELCKLASAPDPTNKKPAYQPNPGCKARLKLKQAVMFYYEQASYADHSRYAVPVEFEGTPDPAACAANLGKFCAALRTHNGFAGSGCTWTAELITNSTGSFVVMDCRASISD